MSDAEIIPSPGTPPPAAAEAWLNVSAKLGNLTQTITSERIARQREQPLRAPLARAGTIPAAGPLVLDLGQPAMGRRWDVKNVSVTDAADVTTAVTGKAWVYVGQPGAYGPPAFRWELATLPAAETFSSEQLGVIPPDHLFVVVTGGTAAQIVLARAEALDYPLTLPDPVMPL